MRRGWAPEMGFDIQRVSVLGRLENGWPPGNTRAMRSHQLLLSSALVLRRSAPALKASANNRRSPSKRMKAYILRVFLGIFLLGVDADFPSEFRNDRGQSGNYVIHLCGSDQPDSQAAKLQVLIPYIRRTLGDVQIDIKMGTASRHGFRSFFKTNANQPYVRSVFEDIADGRWILHTRPLGPLPHLTLWILRAVSREVSN